MSDLKIAILQIIDDEEPLEVDEIMYRAQDAAWQMVDDGLLEEEEDQTLGLTAEGLKYVRAEKETKRVRS